MSILKRFSLAATILTFTGCALSSNQTNDTYYDDDFTMATPQAGNSATVNANAETRQLKTAAIADYAPNNQIVSEVSKKVAAIETKLRQIQKNIKKDSDTFRELKNKSAEESARFYGHVANIRSRLQIGTTPGNPELTEMWKQASALLAGSDKNMAETAKLSSEMARAKNELDSLQETIRETFSVPGAMEIDHENLKLLEDEASQTIVSVNRLISDLSIQITRQQQYFSTESQNVNLLGTEIQTGKALDRSVAAASLSPSSLKQSASSYFPAPVDLPETDLTGRRPLMIIRFDKRKVPTCQVAAGKYRFPATVRPTPTAS